jgi:hypothetical protein
MAYYNGMIEMTQENPHSSNAMNPFAFRESCSARAPKVFAASDMVREETGKGE